MAHPVQRTFAKLTGSWIFWLLLVSTAFALPVMRSVTRDLPPLPPVLGQLDDFELTNQTGAAFGLDDLRGKVWVANFIFTNCGEVCPGLSTRMLEIQTRVDNMGDSVHLVSFSVDPTRDTPAKLQAYAARFQARPGRWSFLTGPLEDIQATVTDGFKMAMQSVEVEDTGFFNIVHGERFVLVDQVGQIRGYYDATDESIQKLLNTAGLLANLGPDPATVASNQ